MTFKNEYVLNADIKSTMTSPVPTFRRGDSAVLKFRIFDNGKDFDLSQYTYSEIIHELPSGNRLLGNPELATENGKTFIKYNYIGVELSEIGKIKTQLTIFSGNNQVSIRPFTVYVYDNMKDSNLSYIGILQELITEVDTLKIEVNKTVNLVNDLVVDVQQLKNDTTNFLNVATASENTRINNENQRVQDENTRQSNEFVRINNENQRIQEEANRHSQFTQAMTDVNSVINDANTLQSYVNQLANDLHIEINGWKFVGSYNQLTQYSKHNIVELYGSTWIALQDNQGNPPPTLPQTSDNYWHLLAHRGVDGMGSVSSVNGVPPDINGNVQIQAFSIGAISEVEFDLHVSKLNNFELKENSGEVYFTFTNLYFYVDSDNEVYYRSDGTGNAGASLGEEMNIWKVI